MNSAVEFPNLPISSKEIIIGEKYADILGIPLKKQGLNPIFVPDNPLVDKRLSGHADLSVLHMGGERLCLASYLKGSSFSESMIKLGFELLYPEIDQRSLYPADAQMNLCICGEYLICNPRTADEDIVHYLTNDFGLKPVKCRQGYTKCSVCVVERGAIITADKGVAAAASKAGIDVLLISAGGVVLDGFEQGFIGGAAFKTRREVLAFTGHLDKHPDRESILNFIDCHGVKPIYLTDRPLFDIGSGLPITETGGSQ